MAKTTTILKSNLPPIKINKLIKNKNKMQYQKKRNKAVRPKNKCQFLENIYETNTFKKYDQILKKKNM